MTVLKFAILNSHSLLKICYRMSIRPSRLMVFAILAVLLLGLEAKPLLETFDISEDSTLREEPPNHMEEKRNKGSRFCRHNRFNVRYCKPKPEKKTVGVSVI